MKKYLYIIIVLVIFSSACNIYIIMGDKDLGNNYYLLEEGKLTSIVYNTKKSYSGGGLGVIPYEVTDYNFNKKYIIAKTLDINTEDKDYWIIDKSIDINLADCYDQASCDSLLQSNVTGPIDSISFYGQLKDLNIKMKLSSDELCQEINDGTK